MIIQLKIYCPSRVLNLSLPVMIPRSFTSCSCPTLFTWVSCATANYLFKAQVIKQQLIICFSLRTKDSSSCLWLLVCNPLFWACLYAVTQKVQCKNRSLMKARATPSNIPDHFPCLAYLYNGKININKFIWHHLLTTPTTESQFSRLISGLESKFCSIRPFPMKSLSFTGKREVMLLFIIHINYSSVYTLPSVHKSGNYAIKRNQHNIHTKWFFSPKLCRSFVNSFYLPFWCPMILASVVYWQIAGISLYRD